MAEKWLKLSEVAARCRVNPMVVGAAFRALASIDPEAWPSTRVGNVALVDRATAVKLMEHIDAVHRPTFRKTNRTPRAAKAAKELIGNS